MELTNEKPTYIKPKKVKKNKRKRRLKR